MKITVLLPGAPNDDETLRAAVCMAARTGAEMYVALGQDCDRRHVEERIGVILRDLQIRLHLPLPDVTLEAPVSEAQLLLNEAGAGR